MKWLPGGAYPCGENGPNPGLKSIGYTGGVCGNAPSVKAGMEGVMGTPRPCIGESGPANGYGGGITIRPGGWPAGFGETVADPFDGGVGTVASGLPPATGVGDRGPSSGRGGTWWPSGFGGRCASCGNGIDMLCW